MVWGKTNEILITLWAAKSEMLVAKYGLSRKIVVCPNQNLEIKPYFWHQQNLVLDFRHQHQRAAHKVTPFSMRVRQPEQAVREDNHGGHVRA